MALDSQTLLEHSFEELGLDDDWDLQQVLVAPFIVKRVLGIVADVHAMLQKQTVRHIATVQVATIHIVSIIVICRLCAIPSLHVEHMLSSSLDELLRCPKAWGCK